ncbi:paired box protein 6, partial [Schistosoma bovis]
KIFKHQKLDYNLDVSYRSVFMDPDAFPENLSAPSGNKRSDDNETDDLQKFLDQVDHEIEEVRNKGLLNDVSNLEMHPSFCERARNLCCCEKKKPPPPGIINKSCIRNVCNDNQLPLSLGSNLSQNEHNNNNPNSNSASHTLNSLMNIQTMQSHEHLLHHTHTQNNQFNSSLNRMPMVDFQSSHLNRLMNQSSLNKQNYPLQLTVNQVSRGLNMSPRSPRTSPPRFNHPQTVAFAAAAAVAAVQQNYPQTSTIYDSITYQNRLFEMNGNNGVTTTTTTTGITTITTITASNSDVSPTFQSSTNMYDTFSNFLHHTNWPSWYNTSSSTSSSESTNHRTSSISMDTNMNIRNYSNNDNGNTTTNSNNCLAEINYCSLPSFNMSHSIDPVQFHPSHINLNKPNSKGNNNNNNNEGEHNSNGSHHTSSSIHLHNMNVCELNKPDHLLHHSKPQQQQQQQRQRQQQQAQQQSLMKNNYDGGGDGDGDDDDDDDDDMTTMVMVIINIMNSIYL